MPVASRRAYSDTAATMEPRLTWFWCLTAYAVSCAGCGTRTLEDLSRATQPLVVYERDDKGCAATTIDAAEDELRPKEAGESTAVVELIFANECSGLGGQYVLARAVDGSHSFWLGDHGCLTWQTPPNAKYGVVRYSQTAALFDLPAGACLTFPGGSDGARSDAQTRAIAAFGTRAEAERFKGRL